MHVNERAFDELFPTQSGIQPFEIDLEIPTFNFSPVNTPTVNTTEYRKFYAGVLNSSELDDIGKMGMLLSRGTNMVANYEAQIAMTSNKLERRRLNNKKCAKQTDLGRLLFTINLIRLLKEACRENNTLSTKMHNLLHTNPFLKSPGGKHSE